MVSYLRSTPRLLKTGLLVCLSLLVWGCRTQAAPPEPPPGGELRESRFITLPAPSGGADNAAAGSRLVFIGVAGVRSRREDSVRLALEEAAKKVSIFKRVEGEVSVYSNVGGGFFDYRSETSASIDYDKNYIHYIDDLEYDSETDVFQRENAVFVRARYSGSLHLEYTLSPLGLRPPWIDNPPEFISGYAVGVGYAGRRDALRDTVIASYENAVLAIIRNHNSSAWSLSEGRGGLGFLDYSAARQEGISARGVLTGFYVLEIWVDPDTMAVWTLAIAQPE
jgi:hypothetical protein